MFLLCPKCGEKNNIKTEKRIDGDSYCMRCGYHAKSSKFHHYVPVSDEVYHKRINMLAEHASKNGCNYMIFDNDIIRFRNGAFSYSKEYGYSTWSIRNFDDEDFARYFKPRLDFTDAGDGKGC